ncbi:oligogalacturonate-specific porin KdgM family protein [Pluralibacter gergoviae]|uniref:oligogalacturonate-specific porin KdgM family protein n=1 Tax=Pluralibacter gergoviae TaxID=61647 RepID=UPI0007DAD02E|nr:oligogalacturonate-specific porin KdgM family protein [Pluralibacter gergoviae]
MYRCVFFICTLLISIGSRAVMIDYRHEIMDNTGNTHKDRLLVSHRFSSGFGLSLEGKWKGSKNKDKAYHETVSNGTEVVASYVHKVNNRLQMEPGFSLDSGSSSNNYRPYLRGKLLIQDGLTASLRFRPYYKRYSGNIGSEHKTSEKGFNLTGVISLVELSNSQIDYELDYKKTSTGGVVLANNKNHEWAHDIKLTYKINSSWSPHIAVGNVSGSRHTSERQTRYRVGVSYLF